MIPFSHSSFLLFPLFFSYSLLNYNGRRHVFPLQERKWKNTLKLRFLSQKIQKYRSWKNTLKLSFLSQKLHDYRWKNTLKLRFLSQKLHEYRLTTVLNVLKNKDDVNNLQNCSYVDGEAATEEMKKSYHVLRKIE
ncbi:hypothetical protein GLYMA_07G117650v4 [Glycine max]|nr:hypothetical protein GLYMA_07G117650v4 [Glycine max]